MKIRNSFVSNSSSSSYIILLPEKVEDRLAVKFNAGLTLLFNQLVNDGELWQDNVDWDRFDKLVEILNPYLVAQLDTGPDSACIILADRGKVRKILNEN